MIGKELKELLDSLVIGVDVIYDERAYGVKFNEDNAKLVRGTITGIHYCKWNNEGNDEGGICKGCIGRIDIDHLGARCMIYGSSNAMDDKCWIKEVVPPLEDFLDEKDMLLDL